MRFGVCNRTGQMDDMWNDGSSWQSTGWMLDNCVSTQAILNCRTAENGILNVFKWSIESSFARPSSRSCLFFNTDEKQKCRRITKTSIDRHHVNKYRLTKHCINRDFQITCVSRVPSALSMPPRPLDIINSVYFVQSIQKSVRNLISKCNSDIHRLRCCLVRWNSNEINSSTHLNFRTICQQKCFKFLFNGITVLVFVLCAHLKWMSQTLFMSIKLCIKL